MISRWLERTAAYVLPARCFVCRRPLTHLHLLGACAPCWGRLAVRRVPQCRHCALPLPAEAGHDGAAEGRCLRCAVDPLPFDRAISVVPYDDDARRFLLRAKNGYRPEILGVLGAQLAAAVSASVAAERVDGVVPVPSSPWARWHRGFEPALEIARELARRAGLRLMPRALRKRGWGRPPAKTLGAGARWSAAGGAIIARRSVPGARILLVDDVLTTGATASACAVALRTAGAVEVRIAVWARTELRSGGFGGPPGVHL